MINKIHTLIFVFQMTVLGNNIEDAVHFDQKFNSQSYRKSETAILEFNVKIEKNLE